MKMLKKIVMVVIITTLLAGNTISIFAGSKTQPLGNGYISISVNYSSGSAETVRTSTSNPGYECYVSFTLTSTYVYPSSAVITRSDSDVGTSSASVSFSLPTNEKGVSGSSSHRIDGVSGSLNVNY